MISSGDTDWQGPSPSMVLVRPQMGENIGAAARAMWNFGLDRMRIVAPRDGWPNERAVALASGAGRVLDAALVVDTVANAVSDEAYCYATTARTRDVHKQVVTPQQAMEDARNRLDAGQSVAFLFGPERAGLTNEDLACAGTLVSVPVNPEFASLNLAQSVLLLAYEWRKQIPTKIETPDLAPAQLQAVDHLVTVLEERLSQRGFFFPETKEASMRLNLRTLFSRMPLTDADVRILHGVVKTLTKGT